MSFQIFTPLFNKIDIATASFVTDISSKSIAAITPVVTSGLTLAFILYGLLIIRGTVDMPVMDFLGRSIRTVIIMGVALASGLYQSQIANAIVKTPDELVSALISDGSQGAEVASLIDQSAGQGFDRAGEAFEKAGFFADNGIVYGFFGILILVTTAFLVAIGGAFLLLAKLALALLAGLGPLFIVALLFQPTQRFFEMWAGQVLNYGLLNVLFAAVFGLMINIFGSYMGDMRFDGVQKVSYALGGAVILSVAIVVVLLQLPSIAGSLASGVGLSYFHELRAVRGMASSARDIAGHRQKTDSKGNITQRASGVVGAAQMRGRSVGKTYGYFKGKLGKAA